MAKAPLATAVALYAYAAQAADELSFEKDDLLHILKQDSEEDAEDDDEEEVDAGWWKARKGEIVGLIPSNYVYLVIPNTTETSVTTKPPVALSLPSQADAIRSKAESSSKPLRKFSNGGLSSEGAATSSSNNNVTRVERSVSESGGSISRMREQIESADFERLRQLREEAAMKINALRSAIAKSEEVSPRERRFSRNSSKVEKSEHSSSYSTPLDSIAQAIRDNLVQGRSNMSETDRRFLESLDEQFKQHLRFSQGDLMRLDKNAAQEIKLKTSQESQEAVIAHTSPTAPANKKPQRLTPRANAAAAMSSSSLPGIKYPFCRSIVYPPTNTASQQPYSFNPETAPKLVLRHVHGYDGDIGRHGGAVRGKNIVFLRDNMIAYPAAALIIILSLDSSGGTSGGLQQPLSLPPQQSFFSGHNEEVTAISCHPNRDICASGQMGSEGLVMIWSSQSVITGQSNNKPSVVLRLAAVSGSLSSASQNFIGYEGVRGVSGLNFTADGRFLIVLGIGDNTSAGSFSSHMVVFDWAAGTAIACTKVGGDGASGVNQMGFNPFLYLAADQFYDQHAISSSSIGSVAHGEKKLGGCYTLLSCGNRQVKFWVLQQFITQSFVSAPSTDGSTKKKKRKSSVDMQDVKIQVSYTLEGNVGVLPRSTNALSGGDGAEPDILCFATICDGMFPGELPKSRILTGTSAGAIYIWEQLEMAATKDNPRMASVPGRGWQPFGRLLSIVTDMHESPLLDIDYFAEIYDTEDSEHGNGCGVSNERLITCGKDCSICVWRIDRPQQDSPRRGDGEQPILPFEHLSTVVICDDEPIEAVGIPRVVCWDMEGSSAIIGTTTNCIFKVSGSNKSSQQPQGTPLGLAASEETDPIETFSSLLLVPVIQSHWRKVRRIAVHPTAPIIATISSDRSLRVWNVGCHTQVGCMILPEHEAALSCILFHPRLNAVVVGNERGELLVISCDILIAHMSRSTTDICQHERWKIEYRKLVTATMTTNHSRVSSRVAEMRSPMCSGLEHYTANRVKLPSIRTPIKGAPDVDSTEDPNSLVSSSSEGASPPGEGGTESGEKKSNDRRGFEITEMKFSPSGRLLAVGGKDNIIHILAVNPNNQKYQLKRIAVCRGHTSYIKNIDFSSDSQFIQSTDATRELLFWEATTGRQITTPSVIRDIDWFSWSCVYGWPVQGIFNNLSATAGGEGAIQHTAIEEINAVCRSRTKSSNRSNLLICGGTNTVFSSIKLFSYPVLADSQPLGVYGGHACPVLDIRFADNDHCVVSIGGNDACIFVWGVV